MIDEYDDAVKNLNELEVLIFDSYLNDLNYKLEPGYKSLNLISLGID
jgi:hypothetical protein